MYNPEFVSTAQTFFTKNAKLAENPPCFIARPSISPGGPRQGLELSRSGRSGRRLSVSAHADAAAHASPQRASSPAAAIRWLVSGAFPPIAPDFADTLGTFPPFAAGCSPTGNNGPSPPALATRPRGSHWGRAFSSRQPGSAKSSGQMNFAAASRLENH